MNSIKASRKLSSILILQQFIFLNSKLIDKLFQQRVADGNDQVAVGSNQNLDEIGKPQTLDFQSSDFIYPHGSVGKMVEDMLLTDIERFFE